MSNSIPCKFHFGERGCARGTSCRFSHDQQVHKDYIEQISEISEDEKQRTLEILQLQQQQQQYMPTFYPKPCKNYPLCKYDAQGHQYCFPCFHKRKIDYHMNELEITKQIAEATAKLL